MTASQPPTQACAVTASPQCSETSTVPNSPSAYLQFLPADRRGDFAKLTPCSPASQSAFSDVVELLLAKSQTEQAEWSHCLKFMSFQESVKKIDLNTSASFSDADSPVWSGNYIINITQPPEHPLLGWIAGCGRPEMAHGGVDLMLTRADKDSRNKYKIRGRHARFDITSSCVLRVTPEGQMLLNNDDIRAKETTPITKLNSTITFGDCIYRVENFPTSSYCSQLANDRSLAGGTYSDQGQELIPPHLDPTPRSGDYILEGYTIKAPFSQGATSVVCTGINPSGEIVVVKKMKSTKWNKQKIINQITLMRWICTPPHPRVCTFITDVRRPDVITNEEEVEEVHLISSPLGYEAFETTMKRNLDWTSRITIAAQILEGVIYIHSKGVMHRDVKPGNISTVSISPLNIQLIDFGVATRDETSTDHGVGTIAYLAPEIAALKHNTNSAPYDRSVDVWAAGLVILELFLPHLRPIAVWGLRTVNRASFTQVTNSVRQESLPEQVRTVLRCMLQWSPEDRISAAEAHIILCPEQESALPSITDLSDKRVRLT